MSKSTLRGISFFLSFFLSFLIDLEVIGRQSARKKEEGRVRVRGRTSSSPSLQ